MKNKGCIYFLIMISIFQIYGCGGCSQSGIRERRSNEEKNRSQEKHVSSTSGEKIVIEMEKKDGVYHIPITINGVEMYFIFDTGASDITMSAVEATFLYKQGKLSEDDFKGTQQYLTADGSIIEGTIVNLETVRIGTLTLNNIQASIVNTLDAPLLLGQSALEEFGQVTINYDNNTITFE